MVIPIATFRKSVALEAKTSDFPAALARGVEKAVADARFAHNAELPAVPVIADAYGVSIQTVRNGLRPLVARQILGSRPGPGGGYWVMERRVTLETLVDSFLERARGTGARDEEIVRIVQSRFPRHLELAASAGTRVDARRFFGTIRAAVNDLSAHHDRYLDDAPGA